MSAERAFADALTAAVNDTPFGDRVLIVGGPAELALLRGEA